MDPVEFHKIHKGKISVMSKVSVDSAEGLSLAYTPGVAEVCKKIKEDKEKVYDYTMKNNFVAIVNDGTRVLGLGNIGAEAGLPVMEGKALLFKEFGGVDAIPISLKTTEKEKIVEIVESIEPSFGGINLEDIETPKVFEIYEELKNRMNIPVFHDDRHGTGIVVLAALINALKVVEKGKDVRIVLLGAGSAIKGIMELLLPYGIKNITVVDSKGPLTEARLEEVPKYKKWFIENSTPFCDGALEDCLEGADVLIAASRGGILNKKMIEKMAKDAILFTLSNPVPEIDYASAKEIARIVATARSDLPNQVNNVLAFPGVFRGALDVRAKEISEGMMISASEALAEVVEKPSENNIIPVPFDRKAAMNVAVAVAKKAVEEGKSKVVLSEEEIKYKVCERMLCKVHI